ncbi:secreted phosphoprotein 24-like [Mustelus asterias]
MDRMKAILIILAAGQILSCSGQICGNATTVKDALNATLQKVNDNFTVNNLLVATNCEVLENTDLGERVHNVVLEIIVQETTCLKDSAADPSDCSLKTSPDARIANCTSQVLLSFRMAPVIKLECRNITLTTPTVPVTSESTMTSPTSTAMKIPAATSLWTWSIMMAFYKSFGGH